MTDMDDDDMHEEQIKQAGYKLVHAYFEQYGLARMHIDHFNRFCRVTLPEIVHNTTHTFRPDTSDATRSRSSNPEDFDGDVARADTLASSPRNGCAHKEFGATTKGSIVCHDKDTIRRRDEALAPLGRPTRGRGCELAQTKSSPGKAGKSRKTAAGSQLKSR